jgi:hypothetical protein
MIGIGGCWLQSAKDAVIAYPGLVSAGALKVARSISVSFPYRRLLIGKTNRNGPSNLDLPSLQANGALTVRYRRPGRGHRPTLAVFVPGFDEAKARTWLERRLGPLARFELVRPDLRRRDT